MQKKLKLGWIGLGVMGGSMCHHLVTAGYTMKVFTRSKFKAEKILSDGATWCDTPKLLAEQSDVIFTMVGSEEEVRDVYFSDNGVFTSNIKNKIFIDMGTTAPGLTMQIASHAIDNGAVLIDAPVSGGDLGAKNACLTIMAGGDENAIKKTIPLFDILGRASYMGVSGSGQHTKMCNQIVVAGTMIGVCEALIYARRAGLDVEILVNAIRPGAAACWTLDNLAPRIIADDYDSGFMVDHFIKDLAIAIGECESMEIELPGLLLAKKLYDRVHEMGHGKRATQALLLALEKCY